MFVEQFEKKKTHFGIVGDNNYSLVCLRIISLLYLLENV